jgi:signal recognition particle GTPase
MGGDDDIVDRGGVFALVGPTGVGKTTTTAKLAARCVVRHGADKLALITTDSYRIGASRTIAHLRPHPRRARVSWCAMPPSCARLWSACATSSWCSSTRWA